MGVVINNIPCLLFCVILYIKQIIVSARQALPVKIKDGVTFPFLADK